MASRPNNGTEPNPDVRDTIFICHASPDDNDFVRWLGTSLTGHGYKVWADLFELKGGSPFWSTIEEALRHHACKMIFVVSHSSVDPNRTGVLNELSVADSIKKRVEDDGFIIPVKIDDTAYSEFPIQIHRLNAIDFSKGWGPKFIELLDALESAAVIKTDGDQTAEFESGVPPWCVPRQLSKQYRSVLSPIAYRLSNSQRRFHSTSTTATIPKSRRR